MPFAKKKANEENYSEDDDPRRFFLENGILLPKLFWLTVKKNSSRDREKLLKFEAEG